MPVKPSFDAVCVELDRRRRITLGLERTVALLKKLGDPQRELACVQVVGTNGKGTTAVTLAGALEARGHSAGAYLSPHIISYTERMVIGDGFIREEEFARVMAETMRVADEAGIPASQFELLTCGALVAFRDYGLRYAVLEAGLGARYDATTAAGSSMVVLTNVSLEHTQYLGESIEEITVEKLAGLSVGGTLVLGTSDEQVLEIARAECATKEARLVKAWDEGETSYQARDFGLGLRAAEEVLGGELSKEEREAALERVRGLLPGRLEQHEVEGVLVIVDGGHNPAGLRAAFGAVREEHGERDVGVVFGVLQDKDIGSMLPVLKEEASEILLTRAGSERAASPWGIMEEFKPVDREGKQAEVVESQAEALTVMVERMRKRGGVVLVTGSLYAGSEILGWLREGR